ncbi:MAG: hypothetical protein H0Z39_11375 [Peptococcaceae bacterium]|nr:hypothetical protein [Peptococcaceae bacterium]
MPEKSQRPVTKSDVPARDVPADTGIKDPAGIPADVGADRGVDEEIVNEG